MSDVIGYDRTKGECRDQRGVRMIEWKNGYGRSRWQPVRCDGAQLCWECGLSGCIKYWHEGEPPKLRDPKVYHWQWQARLRERIGSWVYRRSNLKEIHPVKSDALV